MFQGPYRYAGRLDFNLRTLSNFRNSERDDNLMAI